MASIFDDLPKIAVESVTKSNLWMPDTEFIKYKLPDQPKPPTGIAIKAPFEKLDHDLYRPAARMVAFRVESKDRFLLWIKTFAFRYHSQFGALDNYTCKWTDKENTKEGIIGEIFIQLFKGTEDEINIDSNKLLTFHLYPTTFLITVQGTHYLSWAKTEFQYLQSILDNHFKLDNTVTNCEHNSLLDSSNTEYNDFINHLDKSETKPMKISTPRIVTPKAHASVINKQSAENILASLQLLESKVCEVSNTCAGLKDDNPIDNNSYDNKISELNQNLNDLKENQQKLEKELHGLVLSSSQTKKQYVSTAVLEKKFVDFQKSILTKINLQTNEATFKENSELKKALTDLELSNSKLKTQNEALEDKNQFLKKKISDLEKQQHEIHAHAAEMQYEANVSTQNRFTELTSLNDDMTVTPISEKNREQQYIKKNDENSISKEKPHFLDLEIIIDSHGNGLLASKLYRNVQTKIKVLGPGKKNIKGAGEAILQTTNKDTRHIVLGVGSNDLSIKTTTLCVNEMKTLIDDTKNSHTHSKIHVLPTFDRVKQSHFNRKAKEFNEEIQKYCENQSDVEFILNNDIIGTNTSIFQDDGIHFNQLGKKYLVRILKTHLNPVFGLKPYNEYKTSNSTNKTPNRNYRQNHSYGRQNNDNQSYRQNYMYNENQNPYDYYSQQYHNANNGRSNQSEMNQLLSRLIELAR